MKFNSLAPPKTQGPLALLLSYLVGVPVLFVMGIILLVFLIILSAVFPSMKDYIGYIGIALVLGVPLFWFFGLPILLAKNVKGTYSQGLKDTKDKRTVQDIPTSTIATGSIGSLVEIKGRVVGKSADVFQGPPLQTSAGDVLEESFFIEDGSGAYALVYPQGAEPLLENYDFFPGKEVYVLGTAHSGMNFYKPEDSKFWIQKAEQVIEKSPSLRKKLDTNQDGVVDQNEMDLGVDQLSKQLRKESPKGVLSQTKMVFYKWQDQHFVIGDHAESKVVKRYTQSTALHWIKMAVVLGLITGFILLTSSWCQENCVRTPGGFSCDSHYGTSQDKNKNKSPTTPSSP